MVFLWFPGRSASWCETLRSDRETNQELAPMGRSYGDYDDSAFPAQQAAADLEDVAETQLAVAILVEHGAQQAATQSTFLLHRLALPSQYLAEARGAGIALSQETLGQERKHDRGQDLHQHAGLV